MNLDENQKRLVSQLIEKHIKTLNPKNDEDAEDIARYQAINWTTKNNLSLTDEDLKCLLWLANKKQATLDPKIEDNFSSIKDLVGLKENVYNEMPKSKQR